MSTAEVSVVRTRGTVGLAIAVVAASVIWILVETDGFATVANLQAILASIGTVGIVAVGLTLIVIGGNIFSLALAPTVALTGIVFISLLDRNWLAAVAAALAVALFAGFWQGYVVGVLDCNPIVVTIAATGILVGACHFITTQFVIAPRGFNFGILRQQILGVPFTVYVLLVIAVAAEWTLRSTRFGRELYLIGSNRPAARAAGLRVARSTMMVFLVASLLAGIAGILLSAVNRGGGLELQGTLTYDALAAVLVGGTLLSGGQGSILRTMLGTVVIAVINDVLILRGYERGYQILASGLVLLVVVVVVHMQSRSRK